MERADHTVLVVDDDATLPRALQSVLEAQGYRVLTATEPDRAYALLEREPVTSVLLDVRMPTMSGPALLLALVGRQPDLQGRIALMTAGPLDPDVRRWLEAYPCTVFTKPLRIEAVTQWLDAPHRGALRLRRA